MMDISLKINDANFKQLKEQDYNNDIPTLRNVRVNKVKKKNSSPGIALNVTSLNQQQDRQQRAKNNLYNPKSTYHIPSIVNGGTVTSSVHNKKVFCDPSNSNSIPHGSLSQTSHNLNVNNR